MPAIDQIELHPYFTQPDVRKADAEHGVLDQAWSPIGGITFHPGYGDERVSVLDDAVLAEIAKAHEKSAAQVMLRWHVQAGRNAIPKSTDPGRIAENFDVFDFELSPQEIGADRRARPRCAQRPGPGRRGHLPLRAPHPGGLSAPSAVVSAQSAVVAQ